MAIAWDYFLVPPPTNRDEACAWVAEVLYVPDFEPLLLFPPACLLFWREVADVLVWIFVDTHDCNCFKIYKSGKSESSTVFIFLLVSRTFALSLAGREVAGLCRPVG